MDCTCLLAPLVHSLGCPTRLRQGDVVLQPAAAEEPAPVCVHGLPAGDHQCPPAASAGRIIADGRLTPADLVSREAAAAGAVADLLGAFGITRDEHTARTPERVARAFTELLAGYDEDPAAHLDVTFPGPAGDAGVVVLSGIRFTSLCAHHLLPFTGTATVAYLPREGAQIVGLSKLARVVEGYARRLQSQEVLGSQVVDALVDKLSPLGAGCIITAHHACMGIRGAKQPDAVMTTSTVRGVFREDPSARAELVALHQARCVS